MLGWCSGTVRVPLVVLRADGTLSLAVHFAPSPALTAHRLPHCRLNPDAVVDAFAEASAYAVDVCNLDGGAMTCETCMSNDAELRKEEVRRGRSGVRGVLDLHPRGQRFGLAPGDKLVARGKQVGARGADGVVRLVGTLRSPPRVPVGWKVVVDVRTPHPYAVPVRVRWKDVKTEHNSS